MHNDPATPNPTRPLRTELDLLPVAIRPREREHVAGLEERRAIDEEEQVRMHVPFGMPPVSVDEVLDASLARRDGQDGEVRHAVGFGVQSPLPGVGIREELPEERGLREVCALDRHRTSIALQEIILRGACVAERQPEHMVGLNPHSAFFPALPDAGLPHPRALRCLRLLVRLGARSRSV